MLMWFICCFVSVSYVFLQPRICFVVFKRRWCFWREGDRSCGIRHAVCMIVAQCGSWRMARHQGTSHLLLATLSSLHNHLHHNYTLMYRCVCVVCCKTANCIQYTVPSFPHVRCRCVDESDNSFNAVHSALHWLHSNYSQYIKAYVMFTCF